MTEINELDFDNNTHMVLVEFIEAISRIAEKLSIDMLQSRVNRFMKVFILCNIVNYNGRRLNEFI